MATSTSFIDIEGSLAKSLESAKSDVTDISWALDCVSKSDLLPTSDYSIRNQILQNTKIESEKQKSPIKKDVKRSPSKRTPVSSPAAPLEVRPAFKKAEP